jgi:hypothetical protein
MPNSTSPRPMRCAAGSSTRWSPHAPIIVDVVFTAIEEYAAPTAGFVAGQASGT